MEYSVSQVQSSLLKRNVCVFSHGTNQLYQVITHTHTKKANNSVVIKIDTQMAEVVTKKVKK